MAVERTIPPRAGVGLKPEHYADLLSASPALGFVEVHAENYMGAGGPPHHYLARVRERYPVSLHGVGLSLGGEGPLDREHLARLNLLCERYDPGLFSEHLAWSTHESAFLNDLLPVPFTPETLDRVCDHVDEVQHALGRRMLLENPSSYVAFAETSMPEVEFLSSVARRTGCGLLLDVNNVAVSSTNGSYDPYAYLDAFPVAHVGEMHLAGFDRAAAPGEPLLLIDAHGSPVEDEVWRLFAYALGRTGPVPTLIEWDNDVPPLTKLLDEARLADREIERARHGVLKAA